MRWINKDMCRVQVFCYTASRSKSIQNLQRLQRSHVNRRSWA